MKYCRQHENINVFAGATDDLLATMEMIPSMSGKGECWDNAPTERFFKSFKH